MNAHELLQEYKRLYDDNPDKANAFAELNKNNEFFYSLVHLLKHIVPAFCAQKDFMINGLQAANVEDDPIIRKALIDHVEIETAERVREYLTKKKEV